MTGIHSRLKYWGKAEFEAGENAKPKLDMPARTCRTVFTLLHRMNFTVGCGIWARGWARRDTTCGCPGLPVQHEEKEQNNHTRAYSSVFECRALD